MRVAEPLENFVSNETKFRGAVEAQYFQLALVGFTSAMSVHSLAVDFRSLPACREGVPGRKTKHGEIDVLSEGTRRGPLVVRKKFYRNDDYTHEKAALNRVRTSSPPPCPALITFSFLVSPAVVVAPSPRYFLPVMRKSRLLCFMLEFP